MYTSTDPPPTPVPDRVPPIGVVHTWLGSKLVRDPTVGPEIFGTFEGFWIVEHAPVVDKDGRADWDTEATVL